jgi:hypothetical protein
VLDHISISWSDNKPVSVYSNYGPGVHNFTMQWSMNNEGLRPDPTRPDSQATCSSVGTNNANPVNAADHDDDFHHNFFSDCSHRIPETTQKSMHMVNNIIYNWDYFATETLGPQSSDIIGNLYKAGPGTPGAQPYELHFSDGAGTYPNFTGAPDIYLFGNKGPNQPNPLGDQWAMANQITCYQCAPVGPVPSSWKRSAPMPTQEHPITADDVNNLENILFPTVGASQRLDCSGNWVLNRDAVDTRLINEYKAGTGIIPTSETQVGGFPTIDPGTACVDSDHDGIPDAWETAHGLNPNDPSDAARVAPNGYTYLENYLNGTDPNVTASANSPSLLWAGPSSPKATEGFLHTGLPSLWQRSQAIQRREIFPPPSADLQRRVGGPSLLAYPDTSSVHTRRRFESNASASLASNGKELTRISRRVKKSVVCFESRKGRFPGGNCVDQA